ncbi:MAG: hypothetical protein Q4F27_04095, partial [Desulfovibrionaceae bacterium]|nr:hypothetical protein [Desulfovibrionaceae bacterium]
EKIEEQRDELVVENRQLLRENGELRVQLARLEERIEQVGVMEMRGGRHKPAKEMPAADQKPRRARIIQFPSYAQRLR